MQLTPAAAAPERQQCCAEHARGRIFMELGCIFRILFAAGMARKSVIRGASLSTLAAGVVLLLVDGAAASAVGVDGDANLVESREVYFPAWAGRRGARQPRRSGVRAVLLAVTATLAASTVAYLLLRCYRKFSGHDQKTRGRYLASGGQDDEDEALCRFEKSVGWTPDEEEKEDPEEEEVPYYMQKTYVPGLTLVLDRLEGPLDQYVSTRALIGQAERVEEHNILTLHEKLRDFVINRTPQVEALLENIPEGKQDRATRFMSCTMYVRRCITAMDLLTRMNVPQRSEDKPEDVQAVQRLMSALEGPVSTSLTIDKLRAKIDAVKQEQMPTMDYALQGFIVTRLERVMQLLNEEPESGAAEEERVALTMMYLSRIHLALNAWSMLLKQHPQQRVRPVQEEDSAESGPSAEQESSTVLTLGDGEPGEIDVDDDSDGGGSMVIHSDSEPDNADDPEEAGSGEGYLALGRATGSVRWFVEEAEKLQEHNIAAFHEKLRDFVTKRMPQVQALLRDMPEEQEDRDAQLMSCTVHVQHCITAMDLLTRMNVPQRSEDKPGDLQAVERLMSELEGPVSQPLTMDKIRAKIDAVKQGQMSEMDKELQGFIMSTLHRVMQLLNEKPDSTPDEEEHVALTIMHLSRIDLALNAWSMLLKQYPQQRVKPDVQDAVSTESGASGKERRSTLLTLGDAASGEIDVDEDSDSDGSIIEQLGGTPGYAEDPEEAGPSGVGHRDQSADSAGTTVDEQESADGKGYLDLRADDDSESELDDDDPTSYDFVTGGEGEGEGTT